MSDEKPSLSIDNLPVERFNAVSWQGNHSTTQAEAVTVEEPFEIRVNNKSLAVVMRTPGLETDRELAVGFLYTEGIITSPTEIISTGRVRDDDGLPLENVLDVRLHASPPGLEPLDDTARFERRFVVASSCGLCGKNSIAEVCRRLPPLTSTIALPPLAPQTLYGLPSKLRSAQASFDLTGGLHAAGIFDFEGNLVAAREDIGRHNAVDKLAGWAIFNRQLPLANSVLMVSGRVSFEIVQKGLALHIPVIAAVSAPSSLAIDLAEESGITLIGFLRGQRFNVYSHPHRVSTA